MLNIQADTKGLNPYASDDDDQLKALAAQLESRYNPKKKGVKRRLDCDDLGDGYDESDPFIDNSECFDENVPQVEIFFVLFEDFCCCCIHYTYFFSSFSTEWRAWTNLAPSSSQPNHPYQPYQPCFLFSVFLPWSSKLDGEWQDSSFLLH